MARTSRLLVLAVAWAVPVCWTVLALLAGPSDGTSLSSRLLPTAGARWDDTVRVGAIYGETALRPGDEVQAVDGRALGDWADDTGDLGGVRREVGDVVRYEVRRPGAGLDLIQQVDVTLHRYPLAAAVQAAPHVVLLPVLLLALGSLVFWSRPSTAPAWAFLVAAALLPATLTSTPLGLGVVDLAGARGTWPAVVGEAMAALGLVALMLAVALLTRPEGRARWVTAALLAAPAVGYAVWVAALSDGADSALERQWVLATVWAPALWAAVPALLVIATLAHLRARGRSDVLATRLALLGVGAGVGAWLVLGPVPDFLTGAPLLREDVLVLLGGGLAVACVAVAAGRYHLGEIEPRVRRGLVQALVLVVVGAAFAGAVRAVDAAADISAGSMLAGGLLALLLLPAGVAVQRTVRRVVYGEREFPDRVVSDLRRLDALTAPEDALREALELLARRLHLSFAAVDVLATPTSGPIAAAIGAPTGTPATVDLSVGGTTVGRLRVEVDAGHDPFGPGDRRLLEDVGTQVGALVQAVTANRELQVSRQRLVAAREEERRRLRRDLHDGLGPSLASLAMRLEAASDLIDDDPEQASNLVVAALRPGPRGHRRGTTTGGGAATTRAGPARPGLGAAPPGRRARLRRGRGAVVGGGRRRHRAASRRGRGRGLPHRRRGRHQRAAPQRRRPVRRTPGARGRRPAHRRLRHGIGAGSGPAPGCRPVLDAGARRGARRVVRGGGPPRGRHRGPGAAAARPGTEREQASVSRARRSRWTATGC